MPPPALWEASKLPEKLLLASSSSTLLMIRMVIIMRKVMRMRMTVMSANTWLGKVRERGMGSKVHLLHQ